MLPAIAYEGHLRDPRGPAFDSAIPISLQTTLWKYVEMAREPVSISMPRRRRIAESKAQQLRFLRFETLRDKLTGTID